MTIFRNQFGKQVQPERKFALYANFGALYETLAAANKEYLFHAAESYLKSKNLSKAIELNYQAARYAVENFALDIAAACFSKVELMVSNSANVGVAPPIDVTRMQIEFGEVLMLAGRNEQALKMLKRMLDEGEKLDKATQLDLKYKIGTIYHNTGNFDFSIKCFLEALDQIGIRFHSNKALIAIALLFEVIQQVILSFGVKKILPTNNRNENRLAIQILNKLSYSWFFKNLLLGQYAHFKALNMADRMIDCAEKAETYAYHVVGSFMLFLKNRAVKYLNNSIKIAHHINRKDILAFSDSFGGVSYYYNADWKNAERTLLESISNYRSIGNLWGQLISIETLALLAVRKGAFQKAEEYIDDMIKLDEDCRDKRGMATTHVLSAYIKLLNGKDASSDWVVLIEERETSLLNVSLNKTYCNVVISKKLLFNEQIKGAYDISESILDCIQQNSLIQEYVAEAFSDRCEILIREYYNRHHPGEIKPQLPHTDRALLKELRKYTLLALARGIMYPAHRGAAFRAIAWYNVFKGRKRIAGFFFRKAISRHHELDMRYEEAKSLANYARFFEISRRPGISRDYFNRAYQLFESCGALVESDRIRNMVDSELVRTREPVERKARNTSGTMETVDQIRVDTLYEASLSLTQAEDVDTLLLRIVGLLIRATGAQNGFLRLEGDSARQEKEIALNFENHVLPVTAVSRSADLIKRSRELRHVVVSPDRSMDPGEANDLPVKDEGSAMCVPLLRGEKYLGYVYLANRLVAGLFSENATKAAQIISVQASFLIENARLMEEYKHLNVKLEDKVREQTGDIAEKVNQLGAANMKLVEADRMKDLLSGAIVHDIKNFASGISGHMRLLTLRFAGDAEGRQQYQSCNRIVHRYHQPGIEPAGYQQDGRRETGGSKAQSLFRRTRCPCSEVF